MPQIEQRAYIQEVPISEGDNHVRSTIVSPAHRGELGYWVSTVQSAGSIHGYQTLIFPATGDHQFIREEDGQPITEGNVITMETNNPILSRFNTEPAMANEKTALANHRRAVKAAIIVVSSRR